MISIEMRLKLVVGFVMVGVLFLLVWVLAPAQAFCTPRSKNSLMLRIVFRPGLGAFARCYYRRSRSSLGLNRSSRSPLGLMKASVGPSRVTPSSTTNRSSSLNSRRDGPSSRSSRTARLRPLSGPAGHGGRFRGRVNHATGRHFRREHRPGRQDVARRQPARGLRRRGRIRGGPHAVLIRAATRR